MLLKFRISKTILVCFLICATAISFISCDSRQSKKDTGINTAQATLEKEVVELKFLYIWPEYEATMSKVIKSFEEKNPNIKVQVEVVTWDQVIKVLQTRMASGDVPDVSFMWPSNINQFVSNNQALDLTPYMTEEWKQSFSNPNVLVPGTIDEKLYCIPFKGTAPVIFYNKDLLGRAEVVFPEYIEDVPATADKVKLQGATLFGLAGKPNGLHIFSMSEQIWLSDDILINKVSKDPQWINRRMNDDRLKPARVKAISTVKDYLDKGYILKSSMTMSRGEMHDSFVSGDVAAIFANNNEYSAIKELVNFNLGVSLMPIWKSAGSKVMLGGGFDGFFVKRSTPYPKESIELIKYLTSQEVQAMWVDETGCAGVVKNIVAKDPIQSDIMELFQFYLPELPKANYPVQIDAEWFSLSEFFYQPNFSAEQAVDNYFEFINKEIDMYDKISK